MVVKKTPKVVKTRSQIGKNNRRKGGQAERDVVNALLENGALAERISMMESGHIHKGDIRFKKYANQKEWYVCQVKNELAIPDYTYKNMEGYKVMFMRKPKHKWVVVMDMEFFLKEIL
jgi:hypothetical protein